MVLGNIQEAQLAQLIAETARVTIRSVMAVDRPTQP